MKLTTSFISRTKQIYAKTLTVSEATFKIKTILALLEMYLRQQSKLQKLQKTTIFKTTNAKTVIKAILESPYKLLQTP